MIKSKDINDITIALIGDIAPIGIISEELDKNIIRFEAPARFLQKVDLPIANLEAPVKAGNEFNLNKSNYHFAEKDATLQILKQLNIKVVSLANNHIYDCKLEGLKATIGLLDNLKIKYTGAGWKPEHLLPAICEIRENRIAFLAYVDIGTNPKTENFPELYLNYFSLEKVIEDIKPLKGKVDKIIVSIHWGIDYSYYPTKTQVDIAHKLIDAGVDIIMGHHPHTIQPFEELNGKYIFYSLAGLTFGDIRKNGRLTALFKKSKKSFIAVYNLKQNKFKFIPTKELQGNYIRISHQNFEKWSAHRWKMFRLKNLNNTVNRLITFQDTVFYRINEYFFGYYQNPLKRLLQFGNIKKISKLINDYKRNTKKEI